MATELEPTISAMAARAVLFAASQHGVSPPELCAKIGLDPAVVADVEGRVPGKVMVALWDAVAPLDPDFGLHLGEMAVTTQFALPWHLVRASATLGEGILRLVAAWRVFNDIHPPELMLADESRPDPIGVLRMRTKDTALPVPRHAVEYAFAWIVAASRRATGTDVSPVHVSFEHPRPPDTREHDRIFRCEVTFGADAAALVYSKDAIDLPTTDADPELAELLDRHAAGLLAKLPERGAFSARVRSAAAPLLACGDLTIERVASALGASARSVQRHLHDEGTSFQRVIADLRKEAATHYLQSGVHSIAEVALLLGFSDQSAFHRAFVRWTGRTPGDVRRASR
jgi:AraC-like DNA-binding protein